MVVALFGGVGCCSTRTLFQHVGTESPGRGTTTARSRLPDIGFPRPPGARLLVVAPCVDDALNLRRSRTTTDPRTRPAEAAAAAFEEEARHVRTPTRTNRHGRRRWLSPGSIEAGEATGNPVRGRPLDDDPARVPTHPVTTRAQAKRTTRTTRPPGPGGPRAFSPPNPRSCLVAVHRVAGRGMYRSAARARAREHNLTTT